MTLTPDEQFAAINVLRNTGFIEAWMLNNNNNETEIGFLVPAQEGDFTSLERSPSTREVVFSLLKVLTHMKVTVGANRPLKRPEFVGGS